MKPLILIPLALMNPGLGLAETYMLRRTYADVLHMNGLTPIAIPTGVRFDDIEAAYRAASGILLVGGNDIDPAAYRDTVHGAEAPFDEERDRLEIELAQRAAADKKPLLGICRGSQIIAAAFGGTLHQEIATLANGEPHAAAIRTYEETLSKPDVPLQVDPVSRLASITGITGVAASCHHHEAIKDMPDGFQVAARSAAGIIEVIESTDAGWFCFGIQSHPETRQGGSFKPLFQAFADACGAA